MRMSLGPKRKSPKLIPNAPMTMTHVGMATWAEKLPNSAACTMAARGPTALATSFAPWAKLRRAAESTSGIPNSTLSDLLRFSSPSACLRISGTVTSHAAMPKAAPIVSAVGQVDLHHALQALEGKVGREGPGHDPDEYGNPFLGRLDLVVPVDHTGLDQREEGGGDHAAEQGGDHPARSNRPHGGPAYGGKAGRGDPGTHDTAHDRMGRRHGRAYPCGKVDP